MDTDTITMYVEVPGWGERELVDVAKAQRVSAWRECDLHVRRERPTRVSLNVTATTQAEARAAVREVFGPLPPDAFLAST